MRNLIIGCGYLGLRVAQKWVTRGQHVVALTRSQANANRFRDMSITPIIGDVTDPASLTDLSELDEIQTVLYAVGLDRSASASMRDVYVTGLENVLKSIAGRCQQFLYVSSTSVYGQTEGETVNELSECQPTRENGQICLEAEQLIQKYSPENASTSISSANILRLAGIYGPGRLIARVDALKSGESLAGNPDGWLNLIHVDDAVSAILACEEHGQPGETYLVCDDLPIRRQVYYETLANFIGAPPPVFQEAENTNATIQNLNKRCENRKMKAELQITLEYPSLSQGLTHALTALKQDS